MNLGDFPMQDEMAKQVPIVRSATEPLTASTETYSAVKIYTSVSVTYTSGYDVRQAMPRIKDTISEQHQSKLLNGTGDEGWSDSLCSSASGTASGTDSLKVWNLIPYILMGAYLPTPERKKETVAGENFTMRYAATSMQGWRLTNEDAYLIDVDMSQYTCCFGVFDGHGGGEVAKYAVKRFPGVLTANQRFHNGRLEVALQEAFLQLDEGLASVEGQKDLLRIMRGTADESEVRETSAHSMAGSTACVAVIRSTQLVVANIGDSRAVLARAGNAVELTTDHKPEFPEERRRIRKAGGSVEDNRVMGNLNLSRSFGDLEYKRNPELAAEEQMVTALPDVKSVVLSKDAHFLVLATDGIWDVLSAQECVDFVYDRINKQPLEKTVSDLVDSCLAENVHLSGGLGCDNLTCILVQFKNR